MPAFIIIFVFTLLLPFAVSAQDKHPKDYFGPPVDFNKSISGTFGELRSGHFHAGIDIRTGGVEGRPLMAVADGYVSRVSVGPGGYGKAVYIAHPNGYTSVYAHCQSFYNELDEWVKSEQYRQKSFQVNLFPEPHQFEIKKGQIIALSGNSGSSQGPHLHFEIRKTNDQIPVNPMHFGFRIKDFIRPVINRLRIYPYDSFSFINGENKPLEPELAGWGPNYRIASGDTITLSGRIYFGINTWDQLNDSNNKNGVYSIELFIDTTLVYSHRMDELSFSEARYINTFIDFSNFTSRGIRFQKTYIEPGNNLTIYGEVKDNGVYKFITDSLHRLRYVMRDFHQNESILTLWVRSQPPNFKSVLPPKVNYNPLPVFDWSNSNTFESDGFKLHVPAYALYDTLAFRFEAGEQKEGFFSKVYKIHHPGKAIHTNCEITIPTIGLPGRIAAKALIVGLNKGKLVAAGGTFENGYLKTTIRSFGDYAVAIDTIPPEILPVNIFNGKQIANQQTIRVNIKDDLSGIAKYEPTLNGDWVLMEYDAKNDVLIYFVDERVRNGQNTLQIKVWDERGNYASREIRFFK